MFVLHDCSICFEDYDAPRLPHSISCGHVFCRPCLDSLVASAPNCPNCRTSFGRKSIRKVVCTFQDPPTIDASMLLETEMILWQAIKSAVESVDEREQRKSLIRDHSKQSVRDAGFSKNMLVALDAMRLLVQVEDANHQMDATHAIEESLRDRILFLEAELGGMKSTFSANIQDFQVVVSKIQQIESSMRYANKTASEVTDSVPEISNTHSLSPTHIRPVSNQTPVTHQLKHTLSQNTWSAESQSPESLLSAARPTMFGRPPSSTTERWRYSLDSSNTHYPCEHSPTLSLPGNTCIQSAVYSQSSVTKAWANSSVVNSQRLDKQPGHPRSTSSSSNLQPSFGPVTPLEQGENRWVAGSTHRTSHQIESRALIERKVRSLLNKLTMDRFDSISDQIIEYANKSENEKDGATLMQVIKLVFEKAKDEAAFSEMYARLCRKMVERVSPNVQDETIRSVDGQPIMGGTLFWKYLINQCQGDFERGWSAKEAATALAAGKAGHDKAAKAASQANGEAALCSEEYYVADKAKRQGLGAVRFIGELFKLQMLTERIMHECVKKLLSNIVNPEEEEIESLCNLLTTVGQRLDNAKARNHMDIYFERMQEMARGSNIIPRMQFMLQDVIELRARHWQARMRAF